jgi:hypothetical protein
MNKEDVTYLVVFETKIGKIREQLLVDCLQIYMKKKKPNDEEKQIEELISDICLQLGSMCMKLRNKMKDYIKNGEKEVVLCNKILEKFGMNKE